MKNEILTAAIFANAFQNPRKQTLDHLVAGEVAAAVTVAGIRGISLPSFFATASAFLDKSVLVIEGNNVANNLYTLNELTNRGLIYAIFVFNDCKHVVIEQKGDCLFVACKKVSQLRTLLEKFLEEGKITQATQSEMYKNNILAAQCC